jgi:4-amino-4-deoxychorismate lyase
MPRCFETLRIQAGKPLHVSFHNARFWRTCKALYGVETCQCLEEAINPPVPECRCKIFYDEKGINAVSYAPLQPRRFETFAIVYNEKDYSHKFENRDWINAACRESGVSEVIFVNRGMLQDTSIANLALRIGGVWYTPSAPLLMGTTRARLLEMGSIVESPLREEDLKKADKFAIMNALLGWQECDLGRIIESAKRGIDA